jgi:glyoxylase-like metal-dependent hydrolase (beta-lactamase superfamily II)
MEEALKSYPFMQELNDYAVRKKNKQLDSFQQMLEAEWENTNSCRTSRKIETLSGELTDEKIKLGSLVAEKQAASRLQKAHYLYFLGNIYFQLQRYAEAGQKYREAIELNPRHASAYNNAAAVSYLAGKPLEALGFLDTAGEQGLEDNLNLKLQSLVFEALGRPTEGILQEDLTPGEEGDLGVMRFALAYKDDDALRPPLFENGYVVFSRTSGQSVIIDPGVEDPRIADFIAARRLEIKAVLNTHGHPDHTAANEHYARLYKAPVFVHGLDAKSLVSPPEKLLKDGESLSFEGFDVEVFHTPGHTPGSVCFSIGGFLFTGDTLFRNDVGGVGTENPEKAKAALDALVRVIKEKLLILPGATRVCPGHGKTSTVADEKADNPFLR